MVATSILYSDFCNAHTKKPQNSVKGCTAVRTMHPKLTWLLGANDSLQLPDIPDGTDNLCSNYNKSCHGLAPVQYNVCWLSCDQTNGPLCIRRKCNADMSTIAYRNCRTYCTDKSMPSSDVCMWNNRWTWITYKFDTRIFNFNLLSASLLCYARTEKCMNNFERFKTEFLVVGFEMLTGIIGHFAHGRLCKLQIAKENSHTPFRAKNGLNVIWGIQRTRERWSLF